MTHGEFTQGYSLIRDTGMNTMTGIAAEIGGEQTGSNRVLGVRHNRKCYREQRGTAPKRQKRRLAVQTVVSLSAQSLY